jgi:hypothetical protein
MLGEPLYLRPPDYRYCLRSEPDHPMFTGTVSGGRQFLLAAGTALEFDGDGHLLGVRPGDYPLPRSLFPVRFRDRGCPDEQAGWVRELGYRDEPIRVRRFWLPELWMGISDLPHGIVDLPDDPDLFTEAQKEFVRTSMWFEDGDFAFRCGDLEVFVGPDGKHLLYNTHK